MECNSLKQKKNLWNDTNNPPNLDEILKNIHKKIKYFLFKKYFNKHNTNNNTNRKYFLKKNKKSIIITIITFFMFLVWLISGIFIVNPAEQAVVLRFGKYMYTVGSGPHWIPKFISYKIIKNVEQILDYSYSSKMLTKDENLVSVSLAIQYKISNLKSYLFNVSDPTDSIQQATSSALRQVVGNTTLDQIITEGREIWGENVRNTLIKILNRYQTGITIINVSPQPARAPENVQDAFDDAIKAQEDEKRFIEQALAYQAKVVPIAEGKAKRIIQEAKAYCKKIVLQAQGETAEFLALLPEYINSPYITTERIYLDTIQKILKNTNKIFITTNSTKNITIPVGKLISNTNVSYLKLPKINNK